MINSENTKGEPVTDINSNEDESNATLHRSKSRESSNSRLSVKRERELDCSLDDDREDGELDDEIEEEDSSEKGQDIKLRKEEIDAAIFDAIEQEEHDEKRDVDDKNGIINRGRRRSSSDPVNLSLGSRGEDSEDAHIDVESIGSAPSKVRYSYVCRFLNVTIC